MNPAWVTVYMAKNEKYNSNTLEADMRKHINDDDVTKKAGIVPYLLAEKDITTDVYGSCR